MLELYDTSKTKAFKYFTLFYIVAMFLPRLVVQGMFGDGLLYASIARNMSIGKGSMWYPFFSSSYWLDNVPPIYYENPPLMLWLESLLFSAIGDYWWIEKLYSLILLMINCFLMVKIWQFFERQYAFSLKGLSYLVLVFWYLMPTVIWGNPNNLMDNNLLTFCLLSVWFILKAITLNKNSQINAQRVDNQPMSTPSVLSYNAPLIASNSLSITHYGLLILASLSIFLGILTKGPVALYPLALPILFAFFTKEITLKKAFNYTFILTLISGLFFIILLYFNADAKHYFTNYWEQRLLAVIVGSRNDMKLDGWEKIDILVTLITELLPILGVFLLFYLGLKIKRIQILIPKQYINFGLFFLFLGLSATLPIMISSKQSGVYLIAGLPMFAFSATFFALPFFERWVNLKQFKRFSTQLTYFSWLGLVVTLIHVGLTAGTFGREKLLLSDIDNLKKIMPEDEKVGVCFEMMDNFVFHVNLQRFCRYELRKNTPTTYFLTRKIECDSAHVDSLKSVGYKPFSVDNQYFVVYKKE